MIFNKYILTLLILLSLSGIRASHDMDVAGETLATNALRGQFVSSDKLLALVESIQKDNPWKETWSQPGELTSEELAELAVRISSKVGSDQFIKFSSALDAAELDQKTKETILLLLPDCLAIVQ